MAYQNVGTPRFYINIPEWYNVTGAVPLPVNNADSSGYSKKLLTLPIEMSIRHDINFTVDGSNDGDLLPVYVAKKGFIAVLGHNFASTNKYHRIYMGGTADVNHVDLQNVINSPLGSSSPPTYDGFSISTFEGDDNVGKFWMSGGTPYPSMGSVVIGNYYDLPHSPDINITMTREMDGAKRIRTKGGADLVDHRYTKPAMWGNAGAWELYSGTPANQELSRSGRRIWDLSFSYLQDSDLFPMLSSLAPYESWNADGSDNYSDGDDWYNSNMLLDSDNFFSQVIHKTNGGQLPFIFQPDNSNNNADSFAICKFDSGFKFNQVANGVYNVKMKIREVW